MEVSTAAGARDLTILLSSDDPVSVDLTHEGRFRAQERRLERPLLIGGEFPDPAYERIAGVLKQQQNFDLCSYKAINMKRRLAAYLRSLGHQDAMAYSEELEGQPQEQKNLITSLGVQVSQFFRNPSTFTALEKRVLPELLEHVRRRSGKLRVWSVGCAYGEEPYSVAMLLHTLSRVEDQFAVLGTDLSPEALKRARHGFYPPDRLRDVPAELLDKYFSGHRQLYRINEEIRDLVQFFRHDIISEEPFYRADLILCRNLLIYFAREKQQQVLNSLAQALLPGGYLVLGRAETIAADCRELFYCVNPAERIYQRRT